MRQKCETGPAGAWVAETSLRRIKLLAERKAGLLLAHLRLRGGDRRSDQFAGATSLRGLGITQNQSARWQLEAEVPEMCFASIFARQTRRDGW